MNRADHAGDPLRPYEPSSGGGWTSRDATHLLWRAQFGASPEEVQRATKEGLEATLDRFLAPQEETEDFQSSEKLLRRVALDTGNIARLKAWWLYRMVYSANPLVEKMALLWHGHFATSYAKVRSVEHMVAQNDVIRRYGIGSFRALLHGMASDVAMLIWLDGNANRKRHPNENFAREVMELFALGVGNYTEQDIKEAARAFTGWHVREDKFWFNRIQHDNGDKSVLGRSGNLDGGDVIDICLEQNASARFLAYKLLRLFVKPSPDAGLIERLAERIRAHDFWMTPVLRELLGSRLFFSPEVRHGIIKSPLDLVLGSHRALGSRINFERTVDLLRDLGQDLFEPPTAKGWDGGRLWITSTSMLLRDNFAAALATRDRYGEIVDPARLAEENGWMDPAAVVRYYAELLVARDLDPVVVDRLEDYLRKASGGRSDRIRGMTHVIMTMPEYQLM